MMKSQKSYHDYTTSDERKLFIHLQNLLRLQEDLARHKKELEPLRRRITASTEGKHKLHINIKEAMGDGMSAVAYSLDYLNSAVTELMNAHTSLTESHEKKHNEAK